MTVIENVQMALISHHKKIYSLLPRAYQMYRDEAMGLLDLVAMADQSERHCAVLAYGDLKTSRTGDRFGPRSDAFADGRTYCRNGSGRTHCSDAADC